MTLRRDLLICSRLPAQASPGLVLVSDSVENNFYAAGEWIEYHALFFNREKEVSEITGLSRQVSVCFLCLCACLPVSVSVSKRGVRHHRSVEAALVRG